MLPRLLKLWADAAPVSSTLLDAQRMMILNLLYRCETHRMDLYSSIVLAAASSQESSTRCVLSDYGALVARDVSWLFHRLLNPTNANLKLFGVSGRNRGKSHPAIQWIVISEDEAFTWTSSPGCCDSTRRLPTGSRRNSKVAIPR